MQLRGKGTDTVLLKVYYSFTLQWIGCPSGTAIPTSIRTKVAFWGFPPHLCLQTARLKDRVGVFLLLSPIIKKEPDTWLEKIF